MGNRIGEQHDNILFGDIDERNGLEVQVVSKRSANGEQVDWVFFSFHARHLVKQKLSTSSCRLVRNVLDELVAGFHVEIVAPCQVRVQQSFSRARIDRWKSSQDSFVLFDGERKEQ